MPDKNNREQEIVSLVKKIISAEKDADLVEYLNRKYGVTISKQMVSNFRSSGTNKPTITKLFLLELAEHFESTVNSEEHMQI